MWEIKVGETIETGWGASNVFVQELRDHFDFVRTTES